MDTITHGIAGALISKAAFRGDDMFALRPMNRARILTWSLMLGAIFPDADVFRDMFSHDKLLIVTWHRSITHSLILMPLWALLLAWITHAFCKWRKWEAPSFSALAGIYAVGIVSHILLDLVTTFGTMIWSPLEWSRPAWDMIFIVDFTLSGILLVTQFLARAYSRPEKVLGRAVIRTWLLFMLAPLLISRVAESAGAPISGRTIVGTMLIITAIFLLPAFRGWGLRVKYAAWNRAGLATTLIYVALTFFAHRAALERIEKFAALDHLQVESIGALPLPPSLWHWDGLVRTQHGVYELRMDLSDKSSGDGDVLALEHRYFPDAPPNSYIETARHLPEVQKVLWFARFPVTQFYKDGENAIVEVSDLRFSRITQSRPAAFTYRVRFGANGNVVSQGWATR
ncbi:MAG TPA: metal-dependent hydrolase [Candidatus Acidoferrum sp.]|nr:metal-dependent hydrolase [Candidatus Acidoferrum sp.]